MAVNCTGNPGMAAAGMGDVLSGVIGTLLAQDLPPYHAACCGMFWHGLAGDLCAQEIGTVGFLANDVANALPKARAKITTSCCPR
jgi:NAD(P)H-hydrate epimerase